MDQSKRGLEHTCSCAPETENLLKCCVASYVKGKDDLMKAVGDVVGSWLPSEVNPLFSKVIFVLLGLPSFVGYRCEPYNNPADFFLDVINGDSSAVLLSREEEGSEGK